MMVDRLCKILICICFVLFLPRLGNAGLHEEYEDAQMEYISALVSMATYSDHAGILAREGLADYGWFMRPYQENLHGIEAKFFLVANNDYMPGRETYILAVTGTENARDVRTDLTFSKVMFGGTTPAEFLENAKAKRLTSADPMVHRGFNKYVNTAFFAKEFGDFETYGEFLVKLLQEKPDRKLYMVGHSLGGAVVTLAAARLISMGVDPRQLDVITFGAPAIGNTSFAEQFGKMIPLRRIVLRGDPVRGMLQSIAGGYAQFGEQTVRYSRLDIYKFNHAVGAYVDAAIRNYYDLERELIEAGNTVPDREMVKQGANMVYFSPLNIETDEIFRPDEYYIKEVAEDSLRHNLNGFVFGQGQRQTLPEELARAKAAGCRWLAQGNLIIDQIPKQRHAYLVHYQEEIYDVQTAALKNTLVLTNATGVLTPLQSVMNNLANAEEPRFAIIGRN